MVVIFLQLQLANRFDRLMNIKELNKWLFENSLEDQWWISLNEEVQETTLTLSDVGSQLDNKLNLRVKVLHVSQGDLSSPPWVDVEKVRPPPIPYRPTAIPPRTPPGKDYAKANNMVLRGMAAGIGLILLAGMVGSCGM